MKYIPLAAAGLLAATAAFAQPAPPPPGPPPAPVGEATEPPPPPPRPIQGASVHLDRGPGFRFDLHCAEPDTTRACADVAMQLVDKLNGAVQAK